MNDAESLNAEAMDVGAAGDPQFSFILCRTGTNKNGDHFTTEELSGRHMTAVNKKIDLQHSQEFNDIVGGVVAADYLEDDSGGRVECVGELYINDTLPDADVLGEDRLVTDSGTYRNQSVEPPHFFGAVTHKISGQ